MKNKNIIKLFAFLWSALLIVSCSNEDLDRKDGPTVPEGLPVTMKLNVGTPEVPVVETKALENDNNTFGIIKNLAVLVYDENGANPIVTYHDNFTAGTSVNDIKFDAKTGKRKIYVLTNVGSKGAAEAYATEKDLLEKKIEIESGQPTGEEMMLGCVVKGLGENSMMNSSSVYDELANNPGNGVGSIDIGGDESFFARVIPPYSKITFKVSKELQERVLLSISEVSIHHKPINYSFLPKKWTIGEVDAVNAVNIYTGKPDPNNSDNLGELKDGVSFFMYDNQQGVNGDIKTEPFKKAPEGLTFPNNNSAAEQKLDALTSWYNKWSETPCTYIQVKGKYTIFTTESGGKQDVGHGDIYYRFFLGENATNDFNIKRNTHYNITLAFTKKAGKDELEYEWRVYADLKHSTFVPEGTLEIDGSVTYFPFYIVNNFKDEIKVTTDVVGYSDMKLRYRDNEDQNWMEGYSDLGSNVPNGKARYCGVTSVNFGVFGNISTENNYANCYRENGTGTVVNSYAENKSRQSDVIAGNIYRIRHFYISGTEKSTLNVKEYPMLWLSGGTEISKWGTDALYVQRIDRPDGAVNEMAAKSLCGGQNDGSGYLSRYLPTLENFKLMIDTETGPLRPNSERAYWTKSGLYYWPLNGSAPIKCTDKSVGYVRCVYKSSDK